MIGSPLGGPLVSSVGARDYNIPTARPSRWRAYGLHASPPRGIVTGDLEDARHALCDGLGLSIDEHRTPWPEGRPGDYDGVTTIEVPIGEMYYEVSKPNDTESGAARFLASTSGRGGMYYIAIASDDIATDVQRLMDRGVRLEGEM